MVDHGATFAAIARLGLPGSELSFTYLDGRALDSDRDTPGFAAMRARVAAIGEPFLSGFDPQELGAILQGVGLELVEDWNGLELAGLYDRAHSLRSSPASHTALARVMQT